MVFQVRILVAANRIVAAVAQAERGGAYETCVDLLHGRIVGVAESWQDVQQTVQAGEFGCRAGDESVSQRFALAVWLETHVIVLPFVATLLGFPEGQMHQFPEYFFVAVHEMQPAERAGDEIRTYFLNFCERCDLAADNIVAEYRDAVVCSADTVVKILLASKVGAEILEIGDKLRLDVSPDAFSLRFRIMLCDTLLNFRFALSGVQRVATSVENKFGVFHKIMITPVRQQR